MSGALAEQSQHTDFGSNKSDSEFNFQCNFNSVVHSFIDFISRWNRCVAVSAVSLTESDRRALAPDLRSSVTYSSHLGSGAPAAHTPRPHSQQAFRPAPVSVSSHVPPHFRAHSNLRRSMPNMSAASLAAQQVKLFCL